MTESLEGFELLRCPADRAKLAPIPGHLRCTVCNRRYPIEEEIVRFLAVPGTMEWSDEVRRSEMLARDAAAADYDSRFSSLRNRIEIPPCLRALEPAATDLVVELGCGTGRLTLRYARRVRRVVAVDFSLRSLQRLRDALPSAVRPKVLLAQADLCAPPCAPASFSAVASFQVLEHLSGEDPRREAVRAAAALLAPGGRFVSTVYNWSISKQRLAARGLGDNTRKEGFHQGKHPIYYYNFEEPELRKLLGEAGLVPERVEGIDLQLRGLAALGPLKLPFNRLLARTGIGRRHAHLLLIKAWKAV